MLTYQTSKTGEDIRFSITNGKNIITGKCDGTYFRLTTGHTSICQNMSEAERMGSIIRKIFREAQAWKMEINNEL